MDHRENDTHQGVTNEALPRRRGAKDYVGLAARGVAMGAADVVPGVSGGTLAFILGIYEELIGALRMFAQPQFLRAVARLRLREAARLVRLDFLIAIGSGIVLAILTLAKAIEWLLANQPVLVWSFFLGLILASVVTVAKRVKRWSLSLIVALLAGALFAWILVGLVPVETPNAGWFFFLSGAIAICAMILPGISGAFILVLLGKYQQVLSAVNERDITTVAYVVAGAAVGIVSFAQVLGWLFRRFHDITVAVLTGFMVGSLRKVWPWKHDLKWIIGKDGERLVTEQANVLPPVTIGGTFNLEIAYAVALMVVGFVVVFLLDRWASATGQEELEPGS